MASSNRTSSSGAGSTSNGKKKKCSPSRICKEELSFLNECRTDQRCIRTRERDGHIIYLYLCDLRRLPCSIVRLEYLEELHIGCSPFLDTLPAFPPEMGNLPSLTHLKIIDCPGITHLPVELGSLVPNLKELQVAQCPLLSCLPDDLVRCVGMEKLTIDQCRNLKHLPSTALSSWPHLKSFIVKACASLQLPSLPILWSKLVTVHLAKISFDEQYALDLSACPQIEQLTLTKLPNLQTLLIHPETRIQKLRITNCKHLPTLPQQIWGLTGIREMELSSWFPSDEMISDGTFLPNTLENLSSLERLTIDRFRHLTTLPSLSFASHLEDLRITRCETVESLPASSIHGLARLKHLSFAGCYRQILDGFLTRNGVTTTTTVSPMMNNLQRLDLSGMRFASLPSLTGNDNNNNVINNNNNGNDNNGNNNFLFFGGHDRAINPQVARALAQEQREQQRIVAKQNVTKVIEFISSCPNLIYVDFSSNAISSLDGFEPLITGRSQCKQLKTLLLFNNPLLRPWTLNSNDRKMLIQILHEHPRLGKIVPTETKLNALESSRDVEFWLDFNRCGRILLLKTQKVFRCIDEASSPSTTNNNNDNVTQDPERMDVEGEEMTTMTTTAAVPATTSMTVNGMIPSKPVPISLWPRIFSRINSTIHSSDRRRANVIFPLLRNEPDIFLHN